MSSSHFKFLPLLILVATIALGVRIGEIMNTPDAKTLGNAQANESMVVSTAEKSLNDITPASGDKKEEAPVEKKLPHAEEGKTTKTDDTDHNMPKDKEPESGKTKKWRDALDTDFEYSDVKAELFEDLANRRNDLSAQERELKMREALLKAAEQELNQKFNELTSLKKEIEALLIQQSDEETARITSLVKIYEGMKSKDAARIFNTLDTTVLLQVLSNMSERKSAPIIAKMSADRARMMTIMLAEQKSLPDFVGNVDLP